MTLPFNENIVNDSGINPKSFSHPRFVGYLNQQGEPINYALPFGRGGHDSNITTDLFVDLFYIRYQQYKFYDGCVWFGNTKKEDEYERKFIQEKLKYVNDSLKELKKSMLSDIERYKKIDKFKLLDRDMLTFFKNCYSNGLFNEGFGKNVRFKSEWQFRFEDYKSFSDKLSRLFPRKENENDYEYERRIPKFYYFDYQYQAYKDNLILSLLKDVFISYLGYHSIERTPKTITTSSFKIYETFYNYLLNDFTIYSLPKMVFDEERKMYVEKKQNEFLVPDSELRLKDEIESIKRLVPLNKRYKYYR